MSHVKCQVPSYQVLFYIYLSFFSRITNAHNARIFSTLYVALKMQTRKPKKLVLNISMSDVRFICVSAIGRRHWRIVSLLRFSFGRCAEREKAWAVRLFKLQVPVEKCLSTCLFTRACVRACVHMYIRGCEYTLTAVLLRLTSDRTTNANRKTRNRDRDLKIKSDHCRDTSISLPIYFFGNFFPRRVLFPRNKFIRWFDEKRCAIIFKLF